MSMTDEDMKRASFCEELPRQKSYHFCKPVSFRNTSIFILMATASGVETSNFHLVIAGWAGAMATAENLRLFHLDVL